MSLENNLLNNHYSSNNSATLSKNQKKSGGKKKLKVVILLLILIGGVYFSRDKIKSLIYSYQTKQAEGKVAGQENKSQVVTLDKKFTFPGLDDNGKEKGEIELKITQVEKTNQVIVQEKTYTSKNDKSFLVVNLELKNESTKRLNIFPGDLLRLVVDGQEEKKFAPDLHNNYVLVAPISTKVDRVGFVIEEGFKDLKIQVGELEEEKEILDIKFKT